MGNNSNTLNLMYQIRFELDDLDAKTIYSDTPSEQNQYLIAILKTYNAEFISVYDAFAGYCQEAEMKGIENYPLYNWTNSVLNEPEKVKKHKKNFTVHVEGDELYDKDVANAIYQKLKSVDICKKVTIHDTDPKNNPQMPKQYY
jgi:hypothetical protein